MGDFFTNLGGSPIQRGTSRYDFDCSDDCSSLVLNEPVTAIGEFFHMHNRGTAAVQYQIRNNEVIRQANINFFDFDQAGMYIKYYVHWMMCCVHHYVHMLNVFELLFGHESSLLAGPTRRGAS
jgi:hypothetical protein